VAFVRPELVELVPEADAGHFPAVVTERTFLGEKVEYGLEAEGVRLTAVAYAPAGATVLAPRQRVGARLAEGGVRLLKEEQGS